MSTPIIELGTGKREQILRFIDTYRRRHGWSPSIREIGAACGMTSTAHVQYYLVQLVELGMLYRERGPGKMRLTRKGKEALERTEA